MNTILLFIMPGIEVLYTISNVIVFILSINSLILSLIYLFNRNRIENRKLPPPPAEWPTVTVQLPIYNERFLVERLMTAVTRLDYPIDKLQIQLLDDSDDFTSDLLQRLAERYQSQGFDVQYLHREKRKGYKAGNLMHGLPHAKGEFIAIFDADFIPSTDWLKKVIPLFQDEGLGYVQTRWTHRNFRSNIVSMLAGIALNGHYIIEQNARASTRLFGNFNGSAGVWRKATIIDAGGWESVTLTEDIDLSIRAQLKGWRHDYLPNITASGELPVDMDSFMVQQFRWAKGAAQNARRHIPSIMRSNWPVYKKIMAVLHLMTFLAFPSMFMAILLLLPVALWGGDFINYFWWASLSGIGPVLLFSLAKTELMPNLIDRLLMMPLMTLLGIGISLNAALGSVSGFLKKGGVFVRTSRMDPRVGAENSKKNFFPELLVWGEIAMGFYLLVTVFVLTSLALSNLALWVFSCAVGFFMMSAISILQSAFHSKKTGIQHQSASVS